MKPPIRTYLFAETSAFAIGSPPSASPRRATHVPVEIEVAIGAHPAVLECAVIAAPDEKRGEVPAAIVVLKPDQAVSAADLRAFCRDRLASFKVPSKIEFRDALPKGGMGKILKAELREPFWAGRTARVN